MEVGRHTAPLFYPLIENDLKILNCVIVYFPQLRYRIFYDPEKDVGIGIDFGIWTAGHGHRSFD